MMESSTNDRLFSVLEYILSGGDATNISAASRAIGVNRTTLVRLLADLSDSNILVQRPDGSYSAGLRFLELAASILGSETELSLARNILPSLSEEIQMSTYLVTLDGGDAVYLQKNVPDEPLVSNISVGSRVPAHLTTPGRVLLDQLDRNQVYERLGDEPLVSATNQSPSTYSQLFATLERDRKDNCAWSLGAYEFGVDSCAAAVKARSGFRSMAISAAGPSHRFENDPKLMERVGSAVIDSARRLAILFDGA